MGLRNNSRRKQTTTSSIGMQDRIALVSCGHEQVPTDVHLVGHARGHNS